MLTRRHAKGPGGSRLAESEDKVLVVVITHVRKGLSTQAVVLLEFEVIEEMN